MGDWKNSKQVVDTKHGLTSPRFVLRFYNMIQTFFEFDALVVGKLQTSFTRRSSCPWGGVSFPANRGLSGGEKMRERRETSAGPRQVL